MGNSRNSRGEASIVRKCVAFSQIRCEYSRSVARARAREPDTVDSVFRAASGYKVPVGQTHTPRIYLREGGFYQSNDTASKRSRRTTASSTIMSLHKVSSHSRRLFLLLFFSFASFPLLLPHTRSAEQALLSCAPKARARSKNTRTTQLTSTRCVSKKKRTTPYGERTKCTNVQESNFGDLR